MIVFLAVGLLCIVFGFLLWKKQRISLVHDYHTGNVKETDVPAYTRRMGFGLLAMGAGCVLTGVVALGLEQPLGWIAFPAGFLVGLVLICKAQKQYNGGMFS
jgi:hypothetical protein